MLSFTPKHITPRGETDRWAVILAGGDGTRLRSFTRTITGDDRPKQFCPIFGGKTLLDQTRDRVAMSVVREKTLIVLTESHERFYRSLAKTTQRSRLLIQPANKGTAPAILYSLVRIASISQEAVVAVFPSDHYFADDDKFSSYVDLAFDSARGSDTVTLLGIAPERAEVEYGWIEPYPSIFNRVSGSVSRVRRFWEKPSIGLSRKLLERGCLWNSFVMVGRVNSFLKMTRAALPQVTARFEAINSRYGTLRERSLVRELYGSLPEINFSHEVLTVRPEDLSVMKVDGVGWSDLGEPSRVLTTLGRIGTEVQMARSAS